jgi:hypothetical protein
LQACCWATALPGSCSCRGSPAGTPAWLRGLLKPQSKRRAVMVRRPLTAGLLLQLLAVLCLFLAVLAAWGSLTWHPAVWLPLGLLLWAAAVLLP